MFCLFLVYARTSPANSETALRPSSDVPGVRIVGSLTADRPGLDQSNQSVSRDHHKTRPYKFMMKIIRGEVTHSLCGHDACIIAVEIARLRLIVLTLTRVQ